jgi:hypothetical protein
LINIVCKKSETNRFQEQNSERFAENKVIIGSKSKQFSFKPNVVLPTQPDFPIINYWNTNAGILGSVRFVYSLNGRDCCLTPFNQQTNCVSATMSECHLCVTVAAVVIRKDNQMNNRRLLK